MFLLVLGFSFIFTLNVNTSSSIFQSTPNALYVRRDGVLNLHFTIHFLISQANTVSKACVLFNRNFVQLNPPYLHIYFTSFIFYVDSSSDFAAFSRFFRLC